MFSRHSIGIKLAALFAAFALNCADAATQIDLTTQVKGVLPVANGGTGGTSGASLSGLTAASTGHTIANGNNAQVWNWALTTAAKSAFSFGETTAAVNGSGSQYLVDIQTLAGSTAGPFSVASGNDFYGSKQIDVSRNGAITITAASNDLANGQGVSINGGDSATTGNGGSAALFGGASTTGAGGAVTIGAGSSSLLGAGGALALQAGDSATAGAGGAATLRGGDNADAALAAGAVTIRGGNNSSTGAGGNTTVSSGDSATGNAGTLGIRGGNSSGAGTGATVLVTGGDSTGGAGGALNMYAGESDVAGGTGGFTNLSAGDAIAANGIGGTLSLSGGNATATGGAAGGIDIHGGQGVTPGAVSISNGLRQGASSVEEGNISITGFSTGRGGDIAITSGSTTGGAVNSGNIAITGGATSGGGTGTGGSITLTAGASLGGTAGSIVLASKTVASTLTAAGGTPNSICQNNATKEIVVNAALTCTVSSARFKNTIQPFELSGLDMLQRLQAKTFFYNDNGTRNRIGLIAEDLAAIDPRLSEWDEKGRPNSIDFPAINAVLIKAVQEQQAMIKRLSKRIAALEKHH